jgi:hypothetical protein
MQARLMCSTVFDREGTCGQDEAESPESISFVIFRAPSGYRFGPAENRFQAGFDQDSGKIQAGLHQRVFVTRDASGCPGTISIISQVAIP